MSATLQAIERQVRGLPLPEQLELLEHLIHNVKEATAGKKMMDVDGLYGSGKGLWDEDAQEYVNRGREDRS